MNGNGDVHIQHQHQHRVQPRNTTKNNINNKNFNSSKMLSKKPVMKHPPDKSKISQMNNKVKGQQQQQQNQAKPLMNLPPATLLQPQPLMEAKKPTFEPMTIPLEVEDNSIPSKGNFFSQIRILIYK